MDQKYNLSVTLEDLQLILVKEFGLSEERAGIAAVALIQSQTSDQQVQSKKIKEESFLFLGGDTEKYQTNIFSTRYTVCFSKAMLKTIDEIIVSFALASFGKEDVVGLTAFLCGIKNLAMNCRRISDNECCVYYNTLNYLKSHDGKWFSPVQVMPDTGEDKICINLDKKWKCGFRNGVSCENCTIKIDDVREILNGLCEDSVMKQNDDRSTYSFII